ncbi:MAG: A24 family peptidase [Thermofilaceae archaeon]
MLELGLIHKILSSTLLVYAAFSDVKTREVEDTIWLAMCIVSVPLIFYELIKVEPRCLLYYVFSFYLAFTLGLFLSSFNIMGGADFLALACIGLVTVPEFNGPISALPSLSVMVNSLLVSLVYPLYILVKNMRAIFRGEKLFESVEVTSLAKVLGLFTLVKVPVEEYKRKRDFYSLAEIIENDKRKISFSLKIRSNDVQLSGGEVWVTPHIPYVAVLAAGYIIHLVLGCLLELFLLK